MRLAVLLSALSGLAVCRAWAAAPPLINDAATALCRTNPAYSQSVMRAVLDAQLSKDHDPALDAEPPDQMAQEAADQGIADCATELRQQPAIRKALTGLSLEDQQVGWDAYNTTCDDRKATKAECIRGEIGAAQALRHMARTNTPPGGTALVQACQLVLKQDLAMSEWRLCVDQGLAVHASPDAARRCKTDVAWHVAATGAQAGAILAACLRK